MIDPHIVKSRREALGFSLATLAKKSTLSKSNLHKIEQGKGGRANAHTVERLARELRITPEQLAGTQPLDEPESIFAPRRASYQLKMTVANRNALAFVARSYGVHPVGVLELAPLMFQILAETSLTARREALGAIQSARAEYRDLAAKIPHLGDEATQTWDNDELLGAEARSIIAKDILAHRLDAENPWAYDTSALDDVPNPFVRCLKDQFAAAVSNCGADDFIADWCGDDQPNYSICTTEMRAYCGGDDDLSHALSHGIIGLHEIPQHLRQGDVSDERLAWLRDRHVTAKREFGEGLLGAGFDLALFGDEK
jgi:transcriptional regulator with XRE-family HTH domain